MPLSYAGRTRYMTQSYHDALAALHVHDSPDIITTFTCNPKWAQITEMLEPEQKEINKAADTVRIYRMKLLEYLQKIKAGKIFKVQDYIPIYKSTQSHKLKNVSIQSKSFTYCGELEKYCHWGNGVKLYQHHVNTLFAMFRRKKLDIKYLCTINKTFAKRGQRMYFQVYYTGKNLKDYIDPDDDTLKVKLATSELHANCRIMLGTDKRATITTNWSEFRYLANIHEGNICAFCFRVTTNQRLVLIVHCL